MKSQTGNSDSPLPGRSKWGIKNHHKGEMLWNRLKNWKSYLSF